MSGYLVRNCKTCGVAFELREPADYAAKHCKPHRYAPCNRGISLTERRCAKDGCGEIFSPRQAKVIFCRWHRRGGSSWPGSPRKIVVVAPVAERVTHCRCGAPLDWRGRCLECLPMGVTA